TLVNYPQTYAVLKARGHPFDEAAPYPELHHAPLYALALATVFAVLPGSIWSHVPQAPGGWAPDYIILLVNLLLFWVAVWLVWRLGRKLFDERAAWVAAAGTALSVALWEQTVVASGLPLMMVLILAALLVLARTDEGDAAGNAPLCVCTMSAEQL